jgi:uncharacterized protein YggE
MPKQNKVLVFIAFLLFSHPLLAKDETIKSITVTGSCEKQLTSDRGSVILTVEHTDKNVKIATQKTTEVYNKLKKEIESLKLAKAELETVEYSVNEHKEWENNKNISKGFKARLGLKISTSEIARLGEVLIKANELAVTDVGALNSYVSDELFKAQEQDCLKIAAKDALKKAETLASSLDAKVDGVLEINQGQLASPAPFQPRFMHKSSRMVEAMSADAAPEISGGKQNYKIEISVTFKID